jgi:glycosyltransferase involved in cell wall biosynthesis
VPNISVVIPAYNQPQMLAETLRSVEEQTLAPAEIVIIDDCSQDPLEHTTIFSPELPVRFVRHDVNLGPAASVVHGIREAGCELVTTINHDDIWEPRFLERLASALDAHPEAGFAFCDHGIMRADGEHDERSSQAQSDRFGRAKLSGGLITGAQLYEAALLRKAVAASSFTLVRREALDLELIAAGADMWDYFLGVGASRAAGSAVYVPERLGWYRFSPDMLTVTWADPRKQIEMARPQTAILMFILLSPQFRAVHRVVRMRLLRAVGHAFVSAARARSVGSIVRAAAQVRAGVADARRLRRRDHQGPLA